MNKVVYNLCMLRPITMLGRNTVFMLMSVEVTKIVIQ